MLTLLLVSNNHVKLLWINLKRWICIIFNIKYSIIIIDEFDNLFKVSEKDAFDLFSLSKHAIIIGISNDIEFL